MIYSLIMNIHNRSIISYTTFTYRISLKSFWTLQHTSLLIKIKIDRANWTFLFTNSTYYSILYKSTHATSLTSPIILMYQKSSRTSLTKRTRFTCSTWWYTLVTINRSHIWLSNNLRWIVIGRWTGKYTLLISWGRFIIIGA